MHAHMIPPLPLPDHHEEGRRFSLNNNTYHTTEKHSKHGMVV